MLGSVAIAGDGPFPGYGDVSAEQAVNGAIASDGSFPGYGDASVMIGLHAGLCRHRKMVFPRLRGCFGNQRSGKSAFLCRRKVVFLSPVTGMRQ